MLSLARKLKLIFIFFLLLLFGCSDYKITKIAEELEPGESLPKISVSPSEHDFGPLNADGDYAEVQVEIKNIGFDTLVLDSVYLLDGSSNFTLSSLSVSSLEPEESTFLTLGYDPLTYEINSDFILARSNDPENPEVRVPIGGSGDAPVIKITPEYFDFSSIYIGCDEDLDVVIENVGNVNLEINDLEYFASLPVDFSLYDYESDYGQLPWVILPGDYINLKVNYMPLDSYDDSAYIEILSNDPLNSISVSSHDGLGDYESWNADYFKQEGKVAVDILFVIDNSGSMGSNQTNIKNNFDSFINAFNLAGVDYHIALVTTDEAAFVGDIITPLTSDPILEFNNQVDSIGTHGSPIEKGLYYSFMATYPGGDAAPGSPTGFFRSSSRLVVVYVSDEGDFSSHSSTMTTSDYSSHLLSLKSSSDLVVAHAVAGDYPSGCTSNGGAQFGSGYYDVVSDLGGTFMSICATDWSVTMDTLATDSMAIMSFPLSDTPIEETIEVWVDGVLSSAWTYSSSSNSITFTIAPPENSDVDIRYATWATCE
mgnify:CR=1 FL=1